MKLKKKEEIKRFDLFAFIRKIFYYLFNIIIIAYATVVLKNILLDPHYSYIYIKLQILNLDLFKAIFYCILFFLIYKYSIPFWKETLKEIDFRIKKRKQKKKEYNFKYKGVEIVEK